MLTTTQACISGGYQVEDTFKESMIMCLSICLIPRMQMPRNQRILFLASFCMPNSFLYICHVIGKGLLKDEWMSKWKNDPTEKKIHLCLLNRQITIHWAMSRISNCSEVLYILNSKKNCQSRIWVSSLPSHSKKFKDINEIVVLCLWSWLYMLAI